MPDNQWVLKTDNLTECLSVIQMAGFFHEEGCYPISRTCASSSFSREGRLPLNPPFILWPHQITEGIWEKAELDKSSSFEPQKE